MLPAQGPEYLDNARAPFAGGIRQYNSRKRVFVRQRPRTRSTVHPRASGERLDPSCDDEATAIRKVVVACRNGISAIHAAQAAVAAKTAFDAAVALIESITPLNTPIWEISGIEYAANPPAPVALTGSSVTFTAKHPASLDAANNDDLVQVRTSARSVGKRMAGGDPESVGLTLSFVTPSGDTKAVTATYTPTDVQAGDIVDL